MQGKDEMIDDIIRSAEKTAATMIEEASAESDAAIAALEKELDAAKLTTDADAASAAASAYAGKVKLGELEAGKAMLDAKQKCVAAVYDGVRKKLVDMPQAEYLKLMQRLLAPAVEDGDELVAGKSDKRITAEFVKKLATATKKKVTLAKDKGEFEAGAILRNPRYDRDFTVDAIVAELRERTVTDTVKKLGL